MITIQSDSIIIQNQITYITGTIDDKLEFGEKIKVANRHDKLLH